MKSIKKDELIQLFQCIADLMEEKKEELCEMDARLGDGDLGITMNKGYGALPEILKELDEEDIGKAIMKSGMKFSSLVPSTMGFLMGSGLMSGGKMLEGKKELDGNGYALFLRGFADGIVRRGKCAPGDRTILDAIFPAAEAAEKAAESGAELAEVASAAERAAENGVEATKAMPPKFGKAAVHGDACRRFPDQGACAGLYVLRAMSTYINNM